MDPQAVIEGTRRWISCMVIGLDLCPYAQRVFQAGRIRYSVTNAEEEQSLCECLSDELKALASAPITEVETTLLIHPLALGDFLLYNDFLDVAERLVASLGFRGILQIASFHPHYRFAGTDPDAVENYTNRSPYPMLHLLREASFSSAASAQAEHLAIPRRNTETLRRLGREKIREHLKNIEGYLENRK